MSYYLLKTAAEKDISAALGILKEYYGAMLKLGATTFLGGILILHGLKMLLR